MISKLIELLSFTTLIRRVGKPAPRLIIGNKRVPEIRIESCSFLCIMKRLIFTGDRNRYNRIQRPQLARLACQKLLLPPNLKLEYLR